MAVDELRPTNTKGRGRRIFFMALNIVLALPILAALWYLCISDVYAVRRIEIRGTSAIPAEDVQDIVREYMHTRAYGIIPRGRIWFVTKESVRAAIERRFVLQDLTLDKQLPDGIVVTITERTPALHWITDGKKFVVDTQGVAIKELFRARAQQPLFSLVPPSDERESIPATDDGFINVQELANQPAALGVRVLPPETVSFIREAFNAFGGGAYGEIAAVAVPYRDPQTLVLTYAAGWQLYLNTLDGLEAQQQRLATLVQEKIGKDRLPRVEYVDLKLGESVYYKYKQ